MKSMNISITLKKFQPMARKAKQSKKWLWLTHCVAFYFLFNAVYCLGLLVLCFKSFTCSNYDYCYFWFVMNICGLYGLFIIAVFQSNKQQVCCLVDIFGVKGPISVLNLAQIHWTYLILWCLFVKLRALCRLWNLNTINSIYGFTKQYICCFYFYFMFFYCSFTELQLFLTIKYSYTHTHQITTHS